MTMTIRERLMTTLRGELADRVPWNIYAGLLPKTETARRFQACGLGLMGSAAPYRAIHEQVTIREQRSTRDGLPLIHKTIETPAGTLTEETVIEPHHGSPWTRKFFITGPEDYAAAEFYFRHTRFEPEFESWRQADAEMGDAGVVAGIIMALPILELSQYWMGVEGMAEGVYVHTDRFDSLIDAQIGRAHV